jgi:hypothetical protein
MSHVGPSLRADAGAGAPIAAVPSAGAVPPACVTDGVDARAAGPSGG